METTKAQNCDKDTDGLKHRLPTLGLMVLLGAFLLCVRAGTGASTPNQTTQAEYFTAFDPVIFATRPHTEFIPGLTGFQQTTEYSCGPAALLSTVLYYKAPGFKADAETEMRISSEVGTRDPATLKPGEKPGTTPPEITTWLEKNGFNAVEEYEKKGDNSALEKIRANLRAGIPTIVEWIDLAGHWVVVVGYDDRGTINPDDDILVLADPYDRYDDHPDGYNVVNAQRFYWMWFDARYFGKETWRTMISVTRK